MLLQTSHIYLVMSHVTEDGKGDYTGKETRARIDKARDDGVLDAIVVELVIGSQCWKRSCSDRIGEENLQPQKKNKQMKD